MNTPTTAKPAASQLVLRAFGATYREHPEVLRLAALWDACAKANTLPERLETVVALWSWIRVADEHPPLPHGDDPAEVDSFPPLFRRQHVVLRLQEQSPELNARLNGVVAGILKETSSLALFAETGLPSDRGLIAEFSDQTGNGRCETLSTAIRNYGDVL